MASKKPTIVSAIAAIPKDNGIRLIHDGSRPRGMAMNDYSVPDSVRFRSVCAFVYIKLYTNIGIYYMYRYV